VAFQGGDAARPVVVHRQVGHPETALAEGGIVGNRLAELAAQFGDQVPDDLAVGAHHQRVRAVAGQLHQP